MLYDQVMKGVFSAFSTGSQVSEKEVRTAAHEHERVGAFLGHWVARNRKKAAAKPMSLFGSYGDDDVIMVTKESRGLSTTDRSSLLYFRDWSQFCKRWGDPVVYTFDPILKVDGFDVHFPSVGVVFTMRNNRVTSVIEDDALEFSPDELGGLIIEREEALTAREKMKIIDYIEDLVDRVILPNDDSL